MNTFYCIDFIARYEGDKYAYDSKNLRDTLRSCVCPKSDDVIIIDQIGDSSTDPTPGSGKVPVLRVRCKVNEDIKIQLRISFSRQNAAPATAKPKDRAYDSIMGAFKRAKFSLVGTPSLVHNEPLTWDQALAAPNEFARRAPPTDVDEALRQERHKVVLLMSENTELKKQVADLKEQIVHLNNELVETKRIMQQQIDELREQVAELRRTK